MAVFVEQLLALARSANDDLLYISLAFTYVLYLSDQV